jgi:hypothetical protein
MLNCIYGAEILNDKYNPIELKLTGWSEQINADITNYYDIFGEIYEKYNKPGKSMSPELKLILMLGGSALKFHLNNVAVSNRIGIPNQNTFNGQNNEQDPKIIEQMRHQAMIDRIREDTKKQSETLNKKSESEHDLAAKQMQDMMLLQEKQNEFLQQEAIRKQKIEEFERIKSIMENNNQPKPFVSFNQYSSANNISNLQQVNAKPLSNNQNPMYVDQRRQQIDNQLAAMKNNLSNEKIKSNDIRDLAAEKQYGNTKSVNIKKRDGINVDTSSESNKSESNKSDDSSTKKSESSESSSSTSTSNTKSVNSSKIEKSQSSKNNQSSFSKRQYKRNVLSFNTA